MKFLHRDKRGEGAAKMIILAMIVTVIGLALVSTVVTTSNNAAANDTQNAGIYQLIPLMFALLVVCGGVIYGLLKIMGVL
jgi:cytochrome oxidase Cu insertion factor (SCO1/SenC/PrrC family)